MRRIFARTVAMMAVTSLVNCTTKTNSESSSSNRSCGGGVLNMAMPTGAEANLKLAKDVSVGSYGLVSIHTLAVDGEHKGAFGHTFRTPGKAKSGDTTCQNFVGKVEAGYSMRINAELNIPMEILSSNDELTFQDSRYYWNQVTSKQGWSWQMNNRLETGGNGPYRAFTTLGTLVNKLYTAGTVSAALSEQGGALVLMYQINDGGRKLIAKLTYKKVSSNSPVKSDDLGVSISLDKKSGGTVSAPDKATRRNSPVVIAPRVETQSGMEYPGWEIYGATSYPLNSGTAASSWSQVDKSDLLVKTITFAEDQKLVKVGPVDTMNNRRYTGRLFIGAGRVGHSRNSDVFGDALAADANRVIGGQGSKIEYPFKPFCEIEAKRPDAEKLNLAQLPIFTAGASNAIRMDAYRFQDKKGHEILHMEGSIEGLEYLYVRCFAPSAGPMSPELATSILKEAFEGQAVLE